MFDLFFNFKKRRETEIKAAALQQVSEHEVIVFLDGVSGPLNLGAVTDVSPYMTYNTACDGAPLRIETSLGKFYIENQKLKALCFNAQIKK